MKAEERSQKETGPAVTVEVIAREATAIVKVVGEHDISTAPRLTEALAEAADYGTVLVDLSECTFADSSLAAAVFAAGTDIHKRDGRLEIIIPPEATTVRRLAELTRLADIARIHETRTAAIASRATPTGRMPNDSRGVKAPSA